MRVLSSETACMPIFTLEAAPDMAPVGLVLPRVLPGIILTPQVYVDALLRCLLSSTYVLVVERVGKNNKIMT